MKELITMRKNTRMIVLTSVTAAVYAAVLIPFKVASPLVPGFTEVRPASVIPIICSLMFGPAAAWGSAIGNIIGDILGGTAGPGMFPGIIGNFLYGYIPYRMWKAFGKGEPIAKAHRSTVKSVIIALAAGAIIALITGVIAYYTKFTKSPAIYVSILFIVVLACVFLVLRFLSIRYFILILSASAACGVFIGWAVHIMGLFPFSALGNIIVLNNLVTTAILGPLLLPVLYPVVKRMGLLYVDIMEERELSESRVWGSGLMVVAVVASLIIGNWIAIGGYESGALVSALATNRIFTTELLSLDMNYQNELDSQQLSEELLQKFRDSKVSLSDKFIVLVEGKGSQWMIIDTKWRLIRSKPMYSVRRVDDRLTVYGKDIKGRFGLGLGLLPFILLILLAAAVM